MRRSRNRAASILGAAVVALAALATVLGFRSAGAGVQQSALSLQQQYHQVVRKVAPSVVQIETSSGLGSGIVYDGKGDIVTNAHVVGTATTFKVTLASGKISSGKLVGTFPANDIAVVKITADGLRPATFARSAGVAVGDIVLALGNPLGFRSSVTDGIVSAVGRTVSEGNGATLPNTIQTSAAINPGNSGGALVDISGRVVGIPTLAPVDQELGGAAAGIGFAIPSDSVRNIADQLIATGKVTNSGRAYLGVRLGDAQNGALVGDVTPRTPAARAGIKAGDVIVSVAGKATPSVNDLSLVLATLKPGQTVKVVVVDADGNRTTLDVKLGQYPGG
jgi:S1-C subfamily serine protease